MDIEEKDSLVTDIAIKTIKLIQMTFEDEGTLPELSFASHVFQEAGEFYRTINITVPLGKKEK